MRKGSSVDINEAWRINVTASKMKQVTAVVCTGKCR